MAKNLRFRRGLKNNVPALELAEPGFSTDTKELHIGNGDGTYATFNNQEKVINQIDLTRTAIQNQANVLDTHIQNKVKLNQEQASIDFVENKINADLVYTKKEYFQTGKGGARLDTGVTSKNFTCYFYVIFKEDLKVSKVCNLIGFGAANVNNAIHITVNGQENKINILNVDNLIQFQTQFELNKEYLFTISMDINNKKIYVYKDFSMVAIGTVRDTFNKNLSIYLGYGGNQTYDRLIGFRDVNILNKFIGQLQEIQHKFSVLNNSPSIKELRATDAKTFKIASDSHHVEMADGRTLEEDYTALLKPICKEFVSSDGSAVTINNGIEGKVLSGEIKGQTVKNYISFLTDFNTTKQFNSLKNVEIPAGMYTAIINIKSTNSTKYGLNLTLIGNTNQYVIFVPNIISSTGIKKVKFTTDENKKVQDIYRTGDFVDGELIKYGDIMIVEGDWTNREIGYFEGLFSAETIILNNGQQYPIYEPIIQGETKILKAPKGTQNWVEISANEDRDIVNFDYKLDSINGDLGSVPSVTDYIDRVRKVKFTNTKDITLQADGAWTGYYVIGNVARAYRQDPSYGIRSNNGLCSILKRSDANSVEKGFWVDATTQRIGIKIPLDELSTQDINGIKKWISDNQPLIKYDTTNVVQTKLTDEEIKAYDAYKKVISLPFADDKVTLNEDGSAIWVDKSNSKSNSELMQFPIAEAGTPTATVKQYTISVSDVLNSNNQINSICDNMNIYTADELIGFEKIGISSRRGSNPGLIVSVASSEVGSGTVQEFKQWLAAANFNILYKTINEITTYIPKELVPTILTQQTNILETGGAVKPSEFKVTVPIDKVSENQSRIDALKAKNATLASLLTE